MIPVAETPHHNPRAVLDEQVAEIHGQVVEMGDVVADAIAKAVVSLVECDHAVATDVVSGDATVNELHHVVRNLCLAAIVRHQPVARDLREIMGLLQMSSELERMGDHAVTIARIAGSLPGVPWPAVRDDLCTLADLVGAQVRDIIAAVTAGDVEAARTIAARDDRVDDVHAVVIAELVETMTGDGRSARAATQIAVAAHCLERIADRVTNIAEDLVFLETGAIVELD